MELDNRPPPTLSGKGERKKRKSKSPITIALYWLIVRKGGEKPLICEPVTMIWKKKKKPWSSGSSKPGTSVIKGEEGGRKGG